MKKVSYDVYSFAEYLKEREIHFDIRSPREGSIMFSLVLVGARVEVECFEDRIEYSVFTGDESVSTNIQDLIAVIDKHWD